MLEVMQTDESPIPSDHSYGWVNRYEIRILKTGNVYLYWSNRFDSKKAAKDDAKKVSQSNRLVSSRIVYIICYVKKDPNPRTPSKLKFVNRIGWVKI